MVISRPKSYGFSLIELMIAVALFGILASLAIPSFRAMIQNNQIRNAAESIISGLQIARGEAVSRNAAVQLDLRGIQSAWTVCVSPALAPPATTPGACPAADDTSTIQSRGVKEGSSTTITVTTSNPGPFVYNSLGILTSPVPGATGLVAINIDNTALPVADRRNLRVVIGVGGSARMCDPTLPAAGTDLRRCP